MCWEQDFQNLQYINKFDEKLNISNCLYFLLGIFLSFPALQEMVSAF